MTRRLFPVCFQPRAQNENTKETAVTQQTTIEQVVQSKSAYTEGQDTVKKKERESWQFSHVEAFF